MAKKKMFKIIDMVEHPDNPFPVKKDVEYKWLMESIKEDPDFLKVNRIAWAWENMEFSDESGNKGKRKVMMVYSGNKRLRVLKDLGYEEVDVDWVEDVSGLSAEERRRLLFKMNKLVGEWEMDLISHEEKIKNRLSVSVGKNDNVVEGEVEFSEYMNEENNYVVLYFNNDIDWLKALSHFNIKTVYSRRKNGQPWSKGVGRVVNGSDYLTETLKRNK